MLFRLAAILLFVSGSAQAAVIYTVDAGYWSDHQEWGDSAIGTSSTGDLYDNGAPAPLALLGGTPNIINWIPGNPGVQTGTWSGTIITDGFVVGAQANVIGGTLTATGKIGYEFQVPDNTNSWWYQEYDGLVIDLSTGTATATALNCYETLVAQAPCSAIIPGMMDQWTANAGVENSLWNGPGAAHAGMVYDGFTFEIFNHVWDQEGDGNTTLNTILTRRCLTGCEPIIVDLVAVPAAVWLFGSALVGLGWIRRKSV